MGISRGCGPFYNSALLLFSLIGSLLLAELYLKSFHPVTFRRPPRRVAESAWRASLHRASDVPGLAYELAPNRRQIWYGSLVETNSHGMRNRDCDPKKADGLVRIAALGDSFVFGLGVAGNETLPSVLEAELNRTEAGRHYQVMNFGVSGYSTRDVALALEYRALAWEPDLIVLGYYLNDPETEPFRRLQAYFAKPSWWQHSHLLRLVAGAGYRFDLERLGGGDYYRYLHAHPEKWGSVVRAFERIGALARERGIEVLLVVFPSIGDRPPSDYPYHDLHAQVARVGRASGLRVLDLVDVLGEHGWLELKLSSGDNHLNARGYALTARAIHDWIRREEGRPGDRFGGA